MVYRVYVERKPGFDGEAKALLGELRSLLQIDSITGLRLLNRYDVEGISQELFDRCVPTVFSEPQTDNATFALPEWKGAMFAVEYLPGQFDQRADSASECIQLISQGERPVVRSARLYLLEGDITAEQLEAVKKYVINPVEAREADLAEKATLAVEYPIPTTVETLTGFTGLSREQLAEFIAHYGLAMDLDDIAFCQEYFAKEQRDPTITEIRMIDTYWSDHCRHTTFGTILDEVTIDDALVKKTWDNYLDLRSQLYAGRNKPICLMDLATIGAKYLKKTGQLKNLDESEEINAWWTARSRTGCSCSRTRPTTTPPRSSPSAARPPASAAPSGTPCPAAAMCIRPCASPARAIPWFPSRTPCPASCPSASW